MLGDASGEFADVTKRQLAEPSGRQDPTGQTQLTVLPNVQCGIPNRDDGLRSSDEELPPDTTGEGGVVRRREYYDVDNQFTRTDVGIDSGDARVARAVYSSLADGILNEDKVAFICPFNQVKQLQRIVPDIHRGIWYLGEKRLMDVPDHKLIFCVISKNATLNRLVESGYRYVYGIPSSNKSINRIRDEKLKKNAIEVNNAIRDWNKRHRITGIIRTSVPAFKMCIMGVGPPSQRIDEGKVEDSVSASDLI
jgi:hypothetical protein